MISLSPFSLILPLVAAFSTLTLAFVVGFYSSARGKQSFAFLSFSMGIWELGKFVKNAMAYFHFEWAFQFWDVISFAGATFVFATFFRLAVDLSLRDRGWTKMISRMGFVLALVFVVLEYFGVLTHSQVLTKYGYFHASSPMYWVYAICFAVYMGSALYLLYPKHYKRHPEMKAQVRAVFFAGLFGYLVGSFEFYNILIAPQIPLADFGPFLFGLVLYWAIFRFDLMGGSGLLREWGFRFLYLILLTLAVAFAYKGTEWFMLLLRIPPSDLWTILVCSLILFSLTPLYMKIVRAIRRRYNPVRYNFRKMLLVLSRRLSETADSVRMMNIILEEMETHFGYDSGTAILFPGIGDLKTMQFIGRPIPSREVIQQNYAWPDLVSKHQIITELRHGKLEGKKKQDMLNLYRIMLRLDADIILGIRSGIKTLGLLLFRENRLKVEDWAVNAKMLKSFTAFAGERLAHVQHLKELSRQEHLGKVGMMSSMLAHEIRNPLQGIYGAARLLEVEGKASDKFLQMILKDSERLQELVERFLSFSRPFGVQLKEANLQSYVKNYVQKRIELGEPLLYKSEEKMAETTIAFDERALEQVLLNLTNNALRYEPKGSFVEVSFEKGFRILVRDHGVGVPREEQERLFEPFFTTSAKGTGLGLATSKKIMNEMGGDLLYQAEEPGSSFVIFLNEGRV